MKYFCKYSYYILVGVLFALVLGAMIGEVKWELIFITVLNVFIIRLLDDCFDYDKDKKNKKKQLLSFCQLVWMTIICCVIYFVMNIIFYGWWGLFALSMILYMIVENKHETLKIFFVSVVSMYYVGPYCESVNVVIVVYLILMVLLSTAFYIYKRQKHIKRKVKK